MDDMFTSDPSLVRATLPGKTDLAGFTQINLFGNGRTVQTWVVSGRELVEDFSFVLLAGDNSNFFEAKAICTDGQVSQTLASPMYITVH
jgi:hypothetical protein